MITRRFDPTITFESMEIPLNADSRRRQAAVSGDIGVFPYLIYKNFQIEPSYVDYFKLETVGFLPRMKILINDWSFLLKSQLFALDNDKILVYLNSRINELRDIKMSMKIINYEYDPREDRIWIESIIDVDKMFFEPIQAWRDMNSLQVFESVARQLDLGFESNIETMNDTMTWLNPGYSMYSFLQHVTARSYLDDESFFFSFIDPFFCVNFINVEKEMRENASKFSGIISMGDTTAFENQKILTKEIVLWYGQSPFSGGGLNIEIEEYEVINQSLKMSLKSGYVFHVGQYDRTGNWSERAGQFLNFPITAQNTPEAVQENIVLKSNSEQPNGVFFRGNQRGEWRGKLDISNVHTNFNYATAQNEVNLAEVQKIYMVVTLANPNYNLKRFQKVIISINDVATPDINSKTNLNKRLSGAWLVTGITWEHDGDGLKQKLICCRRELTDQNLNF